MGFPKALLEWEGTPLVSFLARELLATRIRRILLVLGARADRIRREFNRSMRQDLHDRSWIEGGRVALLLNPAWHEGKSTSIKVGAGALSPDATDVVILSVDQPIRAEVVEALMGAHERLGKAATLPVFSGRRGHPVALSGRLRRELSSLSDEGQGLRELIRYLDQEDELALYEMGAPCIRWNFNRPGDIIHARKGAHGGP